MKLSTKSRYGLRLMLDFALNYGVKHISIKDVSIRQELSDKYLEQIAMTLLKAGLITSTRGAQGGYNLSRAPEEITIGQIIRATEGDLMLVKCVGNKGENGCTRCDKCATYDIWKEMTEAIEQVIDNKTLQQVVEQHQLKNNNDGD